MFYASAFQKRRGERGERGRGGMIEEGERRRRIK